MKKKQSVNLITTRPKENEKSKKKSKKKRERKDLKDIKEKKTSLCLILIQKKSLQKVIKRYCKIECNYC